MKKEELINIQKNIDKMSHKELKKLAKKFETPFNKMLAINAQNKLNRLPYAFSPMEMQAAYKRDRLS